VAYCTAANVEALIHKSYTADTEPTIEEVESNIDNIAGAIDGVLKAAGYALPIDDASALLMLKQYNAYGAAVPVWYATFRSRDEEPQVEFWRSEYRDFLKGIKDGTLELPGDEESEVSHQSLYYVVERAD
jgi:hypothetical protein